MLNVWACAELVTAVVASGCVSLYRSLFMSSKACLRNSAERKAQGEMVIGKSEDVRPVPQL